MSRLLWHEDPSFLTGVARRNNKNGTIFKSENFGNYPFLKSIIFPQGDWGKMLHKPMQNLSFINKMNPTYDGHFDSDLKNAGNGEEP